MESQTNKWKTRVKECYSKRLTSLTMGNCQAAEAAMVVIVHPSGYKVDMLNLNHCSSLTARDVMNSYPGHYIAQLLLPINNNNGSLPVVNKKKQLKLLQPHHTLLIGQVYHLITYQDVLKQFAVNKCMKLGRLLMDRGLIDQEVVVTNNVNNNKKHTPGGHVHASSVKVIDDTEPKMFVVSLFADNSPMFCLFEHRGIV